MTIKELRSSTGLSQTKFSERYGIPRRTLEDWETGRRTPPEYVLDMLTFIIASEGVNHKAWVFYEYRDSKGTGSYKLFTDKNAAISYAKGLWGSITKYDQQSYLNDPVGEYIVAEMDVEWDPTDESFEPSLTDYTAAWPEELSENEQRVSIARFLRAEVEKGQEAWEMVQDDYAGDVTAYIKDHIDDFEARNTPDGITITRKGYNERYQLD